MWDNFEIDDMEKLLFRSMLPVFPECYIYYGHYRTRIEPLCGDLCPSEAPAIISRWWHFEWENGCGRNHVSPTPKMFLPLRPRGQILLHIFYKYLFIKSLNKHRGPLASCVPPQPNHLIGKNTDLLLRGLLAIWYGPSMGFYHRWDYSLSNQIYT